MEWRRVAAHLAWVLALAGGCVSARGIEPEKAPDRWVRDIAISVDRGEVGKPFSSRVTYEHNFIGTAEYHVSGLPPGLAFDEARQEISGTPRRAGFFAVEVAIRNKVDRTTALYKPRPEDRWWIQRFTLEIYSTVGQ
jgi:hypothetical protein